MTSTGPLLAAGYTRQSKGKERSIAEQETAIRETCAQQGWPVSEVYSDTVSASRFARTERAGWARLLEDLDAHTFGVLVTWEPSRADRDPERWMALLSRCRKHGILIHVVNHEHTYDMEIARDWHSLAGEGIDSAYESEKIRARVNRTIKSEAAKGKPHGRVTYGYKRVYDKDTRELKEQIPHPEQAPVVKEIITRIGGGVPVKAVTDDLNRRGVPAPGGKGWNRYVVRRIALNPAYVAQRSHNGTLFTAMWPPLVNPVVFQAAADVLNDPGRLTTRPGRVAAVPHRCLRRLRGASGRAAEGDGRELVVSDVPLLGAGVCVHADGLARRLRHRPGTAADVHRHVHRQRRRSPETAQRGCEVAGQS